MADTFEKVNETRLDRDSDHLDRFFQNLSSCVQWGIICELIVSIWEIIHWLCHIAKDAHASHDAQELYVRVTLLQVDFLHLGDKHRD